MTRTIYKLEFILGLALMILGVISIIFLIISGTILSVGVIIPIIFLALGAYIFYLAFIQPYYEEENDEQVDLEKRNA
ncbi:MAG: hypothetical protein ACTSRW_15495 [Candidatus Helarchaeota archaeon]